MKVAGIVAEYNPFHTGHAYQIAQTRARIGEDCAVVAVMSGNWVQQGDCAITDKWTRARLALMGGADLVLELPTVWAASTAESFARGAVGIMNCCGVVDVLSFGSECGDIQDLKRVADCLDSREYETQVSCLVRGSGANFATCRQTAVSGLLGEELGAVLSKPNNNLGVEYVRALNALGSRIEPMTVLREGAEHNSTGQTARFVSATQIRVDLSEGNWDAAQPYLPAGSRAVLEGRTMDLPSLERVERAMLAKIRTMMAQDWAKLPDSGQAEGLPQRLERAGKNCTCMDDFFEQAKTKRYTRARLNRLVLWAYLGLTAADVPAAPAYIRVLGFNERGREVLRQMRDTAALSVITKPAHAHELSEAGRALFALEARCTDLYDLCFECVAAPGREWTTGPVILR